MQGGKESTPANALRFSSLSAAPHLDPRHLQAIDKVAPFLKKCLYLVASKLSLEVVPFWKTQANSGDHSATMFLSVFVFSLAFSLGLGI